MIKHDINLLDGIVFNPINTKNKIELKEHSSKITEFLNVDQDAINKTSKSKSNL